MSDSLDKASTIAPAETIDPVFVQRVAQALDEMYGPRLWQSRGRPVDVLVETVLSQNTSDVNSARAFRSLLDRFGSLEAVADAPVEEIEQSIAHAGLSRIKSARIRKMLAHLLAENGSLDLSFLRERGVSAARDYLTSIDGVGLKTASCVLLFSLDMPAMPVDTHVHRVARRLGLISSRTSADAAHQALESLVPENRRYAFHVNLIEHGRRVCHARRPRCESCGLSGFCPSSFRA
ncbi:MAG: endonuclease III [Dehalococcoidia bacterium]|jgi:endonuclease-3|nr:endonuclease III [Dehalococcoidia bacterium]